MKLCPRCRTGNPEEAFLCINCQASLNSNETEEFNRAASYIEKTVRQQEKTKRRRKALLIGSCLLFFLLATLLLLVTYVSAEPNLRPGFFLRCLLYLPGALLLLFPYNTMGRLLSRGKKNIEEQCSFFLLLIGYILGIVLLIAAYVLLFNYVNTFSISPRYRIFI